MAILGSYVRFQGCISFKNLANKTIQISQSKEQIPLPLFMGNSQFVDCITSRLGVSPVISGYFHTNLLNLPSDLEKNEK